MAFCPKDINFLLSPYTGLTRESWIEAGKYLLKGVFQNIRDFSSPVVMPRKEMEVSYPHNRNAAWEVKAEYFEGLTRTFFIAAPLIHIDPECRIEGYNIREYYKSQVLRACTPGDPLCVGTYEELRRISGTTDPFRPFQQTVETCALVICLWACKAEIWDTYTKTEKDRIAEFLEGYAYGTTSTQNWRLFNMLDMAFLHMEGYPVREEAMAEHAQSVLGYYAGNGWYRDGHSFDYYSCWAFNLYAPIWNLWYGYENMPYLAGKFEEYSNELMKTYPDFFDQDGFVNLWGRSSIYRFAAASPFCGNLLMRNPGIDPGLARRILSGSLLQFLNREDFLDGGIPALGFYGQFLPAVQSYSCAESPFWMGKAFLCLALPKGHPFWTKKENNGTWDKLKEEETKVTVLDGPALCFSNHQANGETILRTGKVVKNRKDEAGIWSYSKLCFNTKYPWESSVLFSAAGKNAMAGRDEMAEAQQYMLHDLTLDIYEKCNATFWHGEKAGVLYRRQFFGYTADTEAHWLQAVNLADFTVPYGIIRADRLRLVRKPVSLTLGAYGFPDNGTEIIKKQKGRAKALILKGHDFTGQEKQLAMTIYDGWEEIAYRRSEGTNPDSHKSVVAYASLARKKYGCYEPCVLISQVITKESLEDFSEEELFPISSVIYTDSEKYGGYGPITICLVDGSRKIIDFEGIEGKLEL